MVGENNSESGLIVLQDGPNPQSLQGGQYSTTPNKHFLGLETQLHLLGQKFTGKLQAKYGIAMVWVLGRNSSCHVQAKSIHIQKRKLFLARGSIYTGLQD